MHTINYCWRLFATGFCFLTFGLGGLILTFFVFPLYTIFPRNVRSRLARKTIQTVFKWFLWLMQCSGVLKLDISNQEILMHSKKSLVLANHPTLIDVIAIIAHMPNVNCIVKQDLWKNPFVGMVIRSANYISNSDSDDLITACVKALEEGNSLVIFPEGTRTHPGEKPKFKRGTAHILRHSQAPMTPVIIQCVPSTLTKGEKWYKIPAVKAHLTVKVLQPVVFNELIGDQDFQTVTARQLTKKLEDYFQSQLKKLTHEQPFPRN